ncbi:hypothetical protein XANCAGTX0491_004140 [Xanthoria calcicola]
MAKHRHLEDSFHYLGKIPWLNRSRSHDEEAATSVGPDTEGTWTLEKGRQSRNMQELNQGFHPAHTLSDGDHDGKEKRGTGASSQEEQDQHLKQPEQTDPHMYSLANQLRATFLNSWLNLLLIFSPVGIAVNYANVTPIAVFIINAVAIIPLAGLLGYACEEIALRAGETLAV